jgi:hypothetical protein
MTKKGIYTKRSNQLLTLYHNIKTKLTQQIYQIIPELPTLKVTQTTFGADLNHFFMVDHQSNINYNFNNLLSYVDNIN